MLTIRKKILFAGLVIFGFFLTLELAARGVELVRSLRRPEDFVESATRNRLHPLRYELIPGRGLSANGPIAVANRDGLRGPAADRPKHRTRVLCLGDSVTFGYAPDVADDATYPAVLGRLLGADRFEVINGGMPGFGSLDSLNHWVYKLNELEPDYVILLAGWNDSLHSQPIARRPPSPGPLNFLNNLAAFRVARVLAERVVGTRPPDLDRERTRLSNSPPPPDALSAEEFARTRRVLEALIRACRDRAAVPIVLTYPSFTRDDWSDVDSLRPDEFQAALSYLIGGELSPSGWRSFTLSTNNNLREAARSLNAPLIEAETINSPKLFHDLIHLNASGCNELARLVAPEVSKAAKTLEGSIRR